MKRFLLLFFVLLSIRGFSQTLPASRTVDWNLAGIRDSIPSYSNLQNISTFGGVGDGITNNDSAIQAAFNALTGSPGVIFFPAGTYKFSSKVNVPDSVIIRGDTAGSTTLKFDLSGSGFDLLNIKGFASTEEVLLSSNGIKDSSFIVLANTTGFSAGDYIKLFMQDSSLVTSSWAINSVGQILKIQSIDGSRLNLESPLRRNFPVADSSRVIKIIPVIGVGLECFKLERVDSTSAQTSNIHFDYAADCWVTGVESNLTNFSHFTAGNSTNLLVSGCYFHHAFSYGSGGKGYGVMLEFSTGEVLVENNILNNLRHSMILQAGANGNVFGYNYSVNPFWVQGSFPTNSAGDIVLHGNYAYSNLFEGNICQNIVIDDSHGVNGPYNTFLRNRAQLYGLVMNNNPASNDQNFLGLEITNSGFLMGNYVISGSGHFTFGNNVKGTMNPSGTNNLPDSSYYLDGSPEFYPAGYSWPSIGTPYPFNLGSIPPKDNYNSAIYTDCRTNFVVGTQPPNEIKSGIKIYPNPTQGMIRFEAKGDFKEPRNVLVYDLAGKKIQSLNPNPEGILDLNDLERGIYLLRIDGAVFKVVKLGE